MTGGILQPAPRLCGFLFVPIDHATRSSAARFTVPKAPGATRRVLCPIASPPLRLCDHLSPDLPLTSSPGHCCETRLELNNPAPACLRLRMLSAISRLLPNGRVVPLPTCFIDEPTDRLCDHEIAGSRSCPIDQSTDCLIDFPIRSGTGGCRDDLERALSITKRRFSSKDRRFSFRCGVPGGTSEEGA